MRPLGLWPALLALAALAAGCGPAESGNPVVVIQTNHGAIEAELFADKAPVTVKNFLDYVDAGHYDGTVFHRVVNGFVIQGGHYRPGFEKADSKQERERFAAEARAPIKSESDNGLSNKRGTLAMARTGAPDSARDQFFINVADNDRLDRAKAPDKVGYCVFGKVIKGMDVVDKIRKVKTASGGALPDVPTEDVVIESVRRAPR